MSEDAAFPTLSFISALSWAWFNLSVMIYIVINLIFFSLIKFLFWFFPPKYQFPAMFPICTAIFSFSAWLYFPSTLYIDFCTSLIFFVSCWSHLPFLWISNSLSSISTTAISRDGSWGAVIGRGPVLAWSFTSPTSVLWSGYLLILPSNRFLRRQSLLLPREEAMSCCKSFNSSLQEEVEKYGKSM